MIFSFQHKSKTLGTLTASGMKEGRKSCTDVPALRESQLSLTGHSVLKEALVPSHWSIDPSSGSLLWVASHKDQHHCGQEK